MFSLGGVHDSTSAGLVGFHSVNIGRDNFGVDWHGRGWSIDTTCIWRPDDYRYAQYVNLVGKLNSRIDVCVVRREKIDRHTNFVQDARYE